MSELPIPTVVTTSPETVATAVFELVYVKTPEMSDVGGVIVKGAFANVFAGIENVNVGIFWRI